MHTEYLRKLVEWGEETSDSFEWVFYILLIGQVGRGRVGKVEGGEAAGGLGQVLEAALRSAIVMIGKISTCVHP